jgi:DNA-binding response OmpR family regulator/nitrogen-specific signal transduction histidine kinase
VSVGFPVLRFYLRAIAIKHQAELTEVAKESQQKLVDAKMNFYTSITHELRTPVFLIGAQLEELLDEHKSVISVPSSYLHVMYRNAMKLNRLVSRVIDFRKMDQGKLKLTIQCKDVVEFCHTMIEDYIELCSQKNITFDFEAPDHPVMLDFDSEKLEMIISNLVSNAYKYTNVKGNVSLSIDDWEDRVVFSVKDNGIGIEEKVKDTIFESFFRSEGGQKQSRGDGIGLSFVKDLLDMHGGTIRVESEVNKGSNFIFDIPKKRGDEAQESIVMPFEELESESVDDKEKKRNVSGELNVINPAATHSILVIDDERETVNLLERNLVKDFKIYKAYNGEEGLQVARETLPDLIICDMMMPKMDGLEFLKQLKNDKKLQHIKIIIFTAKTSEDAMMTAFDHGADAYLTKPISLKLLRTRVDRMIAESENATITSNFSKEKKSYNKEEQIFLLRCREIIDDQIQNPDFNIDFLADKLAMSHSALYKKIKIMTGMSLIEFINDYKIYKAVLLFKQGTTSIETVCEQCGFNDVKNFRNLFKRKMNMTPKQYVQSL